MWVTLRPASAESMVLSTSDFRFVSSALPQKTSTPLESMKALFDEVFPAE